MVISQSSLHVKHPSAKLLLLEFSCSRVLSRAFRRPRLTSWPCGVPLLCRSPPEVPCHEQIKHPLSVQQLFRLGLHHSRAGIFINSQKLENSECLPISYLIPVPALSFCLSKARDNGLLTEVALCPAKRALCRQLWRCSFLPWLSCLCLTSESKALTMPWTFSVPHLTMKVKAKGYLFSLLLPCTSR